MHRYKIILYGSNDGQAFIAEAPGTARPHGTRTIRKRRKRIQDATQFWIDTAGELGRSVPQPKGTRLMYA
ncbi:MAG: type II toxin-antitoxin system HicB family antitoxin [Gammaproteobacteria bacterium]|nr:type II toxin-antitoxin system HicB family antitoxin [Gammaproteobacteria bacterium]MXY58078.1 type II toxin-antitoxin system HicB family antitoxin [Gammaproteobacteria bacterium]MYF31761.1 type II toxin-antitoxin system HicB family antitoxin [Gammaproteobacteria bacterium]MYK44908.1 type II toxin-antitoxin system HicB family antitoxin [Gammaproteobacteria bacterium]